MKKYGLTGGVGCGKSEASRMLEGLGWKVIDTDAITHGLYAAGGAGQKKIVDALGRSVLNEDESVDRVSLGRLVFSDPEKRRLLNSLVHPLIREVWQQQYQKHLLESPKIPVLVVIPLLFESGVAGWFDSIACVACSKAEQRRRLAAQGREMIEQRLEAQLPLETKMEQSQVVLWNNGSREHLRAQVRFLDALWLGGDRSR